MSLQYGVSSLVQHLQGLTHQLTELEKLGLLSATGQSLLSLCRKMTRIQYMDGSAQKGGPGNQPTSGTSTSRPPSGASGWGSDLWKQQLGSTIQSASLGQQNASQKDTLYSMTHGAEKASESANWRSKDGFGSH